MTTRSAWMRVKSSWLAGWLLLLTGIGSIGGETAFPVKVHAGTIEKMERLETPLSFVKLGEALQSNDTTAPEIVPDWLREDRPAPEGLVYVVFTVAVLPERSLSRFDYVLIADGVESPCLGLALEQAGVFDDRRLEQRGAGVVKMAFACSASAADASLTCRFPDLPMITVPGIVLIPKPPEPEPTAAVPAAPAAVPAEAAAAPAPAVDAAPAAAPAPAPAVDAAPAAAPAPAPAAPKPAPAAPKPAGDIFTF